MDDFNDLEFDIENMAPDTSLENPLGNFGSVKQVLDRYLHCAICGSNLHFTHLTDFTRNITEENSKCPECGVKAQRSLHKLQ